MTSEQALLTCAHAALEMAAVQPCRSPYCECDSGKCSHPGFVDCRAAEGACRPLVDPELRKSLLLLSDQLLDTSSRPAHTKALLAALRRQPLAVKHGD